MNSLPSPIDKYDHVYDGGEVRLLYFKNPPATGAYDIECPHCIVVTDGERPRMIVRFERDNHGCMLYSIMPNGDATYYSDVPSLNEAGFVSKVIELFETQKAEQTSQKNQTLKQRKDMTPFPSAQLYRILLRLNQLKRIWLIHMDYIFRRTSYQ